MLLARAGHHFSGVALGLLQGRFTGRPAPVCQKGKQNSTAHSILPPESHQPGLNKDVLASWTFFALAEMVENANMSGRIFGTYWEVGVVGSSHARPRVRHTTRGLIDRCGRMRMEMLVGRTPTCFILGSGS